MEFVNIIEQCNFMILNINTLRHIVHSNFLHVAFGSRELLYTLGLEFESKEAFKKFDAKIIGIILKMKK